MVQRISPVPEQVDGILNNLAFKFSVVNGTTANTNIAVSGSTPRTGSSQWSSWTSRWLKVHLTPGLGKLRT